MGLFEVPGWTVSTEPATSNTSTRKHAKRKRGEEETLTHVAKNMEVLMRQLGDSESSRATEPRKKRIKECKDASRTFIGSSTIATTNLTDKATDARRKRRKNLNPRQSVKPRNLEIPYESVSKEGSAVTPLQSKMEKSLGGAKFRIINEVLYKSNSAKAHRMMQEDPSMFDEYHVGFRSQSSSWPTNPVEHYIATLSTMPKGTVIADLGCGDAALARALLPKGFVVLSYDLISRDSSGMVVEADICANIPLPGKKDDEEWDEVSIEAQVVNVCICSLSLMSTNWVGCVRECWRILKMGGVLKVAEVTSRLKNVKRFIDLVNSVGFKIVSKDASNTHFMLFEFQKISCPKKSDVEWLELIEKGNVLQPCEYKRR